MVLSHTPGIFGPVHKSTDSCPIGNGDLLSHATVVIVIVVAVAKKRPLGPPQFSIDSLPNHCTSVSHFAIVVVVVVVIVVVDSTRPPSPKHTQHGCPR